MIKNILLCLRELTWLAYEIPTMLLYTMFMWLHMMSPDNVIHERLKILGHQLFSYDSNYKCSGQKHMCIYITHEVSLALSLI